MFGYFIPCRVFYSGDFNIILNRFLSICDYIVVNSSTLNVTFIIFNAFFVPFLLTVTILFGFGGRITFSEKFIEILLLKSATAEVIKALGCRMGFVCLMAVYHP